MNFTHSVSFLDVLIFVKILLSILRVNFHECFLNGVETFVWIWIKHLYVFKGKFDSLSN